MVLRMGRDNPRERVSIATHEDIEQAGCHAAATHTPESTIDRNGQTMMSPRLR
jgi:hypothetical protein